jgi:hypothetical protein
MTRLLHRQFEVPVARSRAWRRLARLEEWPAWAAHIRRIDVSPRGELGPESSGSIVLRNGIRSTFRMREIRPETNGRWSGRFLWLTVHYDHRFEATASDRTRLTWIVDAEGLGAAVLGRVFARAYSRNLDRAIPVLVSTLGRKEMS